MPRDKSSRSGTTVIAALPPGAAHHPQRGYFGVAWVLGAAPAEPELAATRGREGPRVVALEPGSDPCPVEEGALVSCIRFTEP